MIKDGVDLKLHHHRLQPTVAGGTRQRPLHRPWHRRLGCDAAARSRGFEEEQHTNRNPAIELGVTCNAEIYMYMYSLYM